jgi:hypothetical protein
MAPATVEKDIFVALFFLSGGNHNFDLVPASVKDDGCIIDAFGCFVAVNVAKGGRICLRTARRFFSSAAGEGKRG